MPDYLTLPAQIAGITVAVVWLGVMLRIGWELGGRAFGWVRVALGIPSRFTVYKGTRGGRWVVDDCSRIIHVDLQRHRDD